MTTKYSTCLGAIKCPICGKRGQLKLRRVHTTDHALHFDVDHWKVGNSHSSGYSHKCYIGVATEETAKELYKLNNRKKILVEVAENGVL